MGPNYEGRERHSTFGGKREPNRANSHTRPVAYLGFFLPPPRAGESAAGPPRGSFPWMPARVATLMHIPSAYHAMPHAIPSSPSAAVGFGETPSETPAYGNVDTGPPRSNTDGGRTRRTPPERMGRSAGSGRAMAGRNAPAGRGGRLAGHPPRNSPPMVEIRPAGSREDGSVPAIASPLPAGRCRATHGGTVGRAKADRVTTPPLPNGLRQKPKRPVHTHVAEIGSLPPGRYRPLGKATDVNRGCFKENHGRMFRIGGRWPTITRPRRTRKPPCVCHGHAAANYKGFFCCPEAFSTSELAKSQTLSDTAPPFGRRTEAAPFVTVAPRKNRDWQTHPPRGRFSPAEGNT